MKTSLFTVIYLIITLSGNAQKSDLAEELVQELTGEALESVAGNEGYDYRLIEDMKAIDINKASKSELELIPWLTPVQVRSLLRYIDINGPLVSIYELQAVPGWDLSTIRMTTPLFKVRDTGPHRDPRRLKERLKHDGGADLRFRVKRRIQLSHGYLGTGTARFAGSPYYWLAKFRYHQKGTIDLGINSEKDAGERFIWNPRKGIYGPDHLSMYLQLENRGIVRKLLIGDFRLQWDQGLIHGSGLIFKKQVITGPRKVHSGFTRHSGTREYGFFRGAALEIEIPKLVFSIFFSRRKLDAQILEEDSIAKLPARAPSIIETGHHRTLTELDRRNRLLESTMGIHVRGTWRKDLDLTVSGSYRKFGSHLIPTPARHNLYAFSGKSNTNLSVGVEYIIDNLNLFGQVAVSSSSGWAALAGMIGSLSHKVSVSLHLRNYQKDFHGNSGGSYGVSQVNSNEQGIYLGLQITPGESWTIGTYTNLFTSNFPTYSADAAFGGIEYLIRTQFVANKNTSVDFYWRNRKRSTNSKLPTAKITHDLNEESKHSAGLRLKWQNDQRITLQTRIQYSRYSLSKYSSSGLIVANQVSYHHKIIKIAAGMAHFDTDDFENRQYIYENDLPYSLSIPFFDGTGTRWFGMIQLKALKNVDFWLKIAQSHYHNRRQLGNGPDLTDSSLRSDLSLQLRYKL